MNKSIPFRTGVTAALAIGALCSGARLTDAATYIQTDLARIMRSRLADVA